MHRYAVRQESLQGVRGAWWPKMVGPEGRESPSTIGPFTLWQQPHPIYLAELLYRAVPTRATLERYRELVFETAKLLASLSHLDLERDQYVLGPPVIPAQEVHLEEHAADLANAASPDGSGYRRDAETYFPSNGSLLLAIGLMAAGWDGESAVHPGFPNDGSWVVRSEGLSPLP